MMNLHFKMMNFSGRPSGRKPTGDLFIYLFTQCLASQWEKRALPLIPVNETINRVVLLKKRGVVGEIRVSYGGFSLDGVEFQVSFEYESCI